MKDRRFELKMQVPGTDSSGAAAAILILGLGNILMGDDGVGCSVIHELQDVEWPAEVAVIDAGTSALSLLEEISRSNVLIAVDAVGRVASPERCIAWLWASRMINCFPARLVLAA